MTIAFVTGANGFLAQHLVKYLLAKDFTVIGSVRSEEKGECLNTLFEHPNFTYAVVEDFVKEDAFFEVLQSNPEIGVFFHTASPFVFPESDFDRLIIKPAVEGTKHALKAVQKYGKNITKFVLTSSGSAMIPSEDTKVITEETWTQVTYEEALKDKELAYVASKTFAEQAAWKFVKDERPHFELAVILPMLILGPQAYDSSAKGTLNYSAEVIHRYLKLKSTDPLPRERGPWYDVRDVARAHVTAYEKVEANNQRVVLQNGIFSPQLVLNTLHKNFPQLKDIPVGKPETVDESLETYPPYDTSKSTKILGFTPIEFETTIVDAVSQVLKNEQD